MDFEPIVVLIAFVLMGGIIAVIADELGRRIGKRRLTLHRRIRPKHSARILTFLSGMLITIFTIVLIGLSSSDMRMVLLRGRTLIRQEQAQIDQLRREQDKLTSDNKGLLAANKDLATRNSTLTTQRDSLQTQVGTDDAKLKTYETRLSDARTKADIAASKAAQVNRRMAGLMRQSDGVNRELTAKKIDLDTKKKSLASLQKQLEYVSKAYGETSTRNLSLEQQKGELEKQVIAKAQEVQNAQKTVGELDSQKTALQQEISADQMSLEQLQSQVASAKQQFEQVKGIAEEGVVHARFDGILISQGEELARVEVPAGTSKDSALAKIETAILLSKGTAKSRGAKPWNHLEYAGMIPIPERQGEDMSVQAQKDLLASDLAGRPDDQILVARAYMNAFTNESVVLTFGFQANPVVYQAEDVIAEVRVNGRDDLSKIHASLDGLGSRIRSQALKQGMIPVQRSDTSFGSVSFEEILSLYGEIQKAGGSVRVRAKARRTTRAADPLLLDFEVR